MCVLPERDIIKGMDHSSYGKPMKRIVLLYNFKFENMKHSKNADTLMSVAFDM